MPRTSRVVAVDYPHHITQRGNNRELVFFDDQDRQSYLDILAHYSRKFRVDIWAYCLMPNHVHLLAVPREDISLARGIGMTNQAYTQHVNRKYIRTGRIWQNRFFSCPITAENHLWAVARYIENNPVKAGLATDAQEYRWSSARHHVLGCADSLLTEGAWLSESELDSYRKMMQQNDDQFDTKLRIATRRGQELGTL